MMNLFDPLKDITAIGDLLKSIGATLDWIRVVRDILVRILVLAMVTTPLEVCKAWIRPGIKI